MLDVTTLNKNTDLTYPKEILSWTNVDLYPGVLWDFCYCFIIYYYFVSICWHFLFFFGVSQKGGFIATKNKLIISFCFQTCFPFVQVPVCSVSADVFLWELVSIWLCLPATISSFKCWQRQRDTFVTVSGATAGHGKCGFVALVLFTALVAYYTCTHHFEVCCFWEQFDIKLKCWVHDGPLSSKQHCASQALGCESSKKAIQTALILCSVKQLCGISDSCQCEKYDINSEP